MYGASFQLITKKESKLLIILISAVFKIYITIFLAIKIKNDIFPKFRNNLTNNSY